MLLTQVVIVMKLFQMLMISAQLTLNVNNANVYQQVQVSMITQLINKN